MKILFTLIMLLTAIAAFANTPPAPVRFTLVGSTANANGASVTANAITLEPGNGTYPGVILPADWNRFNAAQSALSFVSPLVNTAGSVAIPLATSSVNGYMSASDRALFNSKSPTQEVEQLFWVDNMRPDIGPGCSSPPPGGCLTATGSVAAPFLTIQAAVNAVSAALAEIEIAPGAYPENVTLNGGNIQQLIIYGHNSQINPASGYSIDSHLLNTGIYHLEIWDMLLENAVNMTGDVNGTQFCSTQCEFHHMSFAGDVDFTNLEQFDIYDSYEAANINATNAVSVMYGGVGSFGDINIVTNGGNQPSGFSASEVIMEHTQTTGNVTLDSGSLFNARRASIVGTSGNTLSIAGTAYIQAGAELRDNATGSGTYVERGGSHIGSIANTLTIQYPATSGLQYLALAPQAPSASPTCGAAQTGYLTLTSAFVGCVCNGSAWKKLVDGSTACTF